MNLHNSGSGCLHFDDDEDHDLFRAAWGYFLDGCLEVVRDVRTGIWGVGPVVTNGMGRRQRAGNIPGQNVVKPWWDLNVFSENKYETPVRRITTTMETGFVRTMHQGSFSHHHALITDTAPGLVSNSIFQFLGNAANSIRRNQPPHSGGSVAFSPANNPGAPLSQPVDPRAKHRLNFIATMAKYDSDPACPLLLQQGNGCGAFCNGVKFDAAIVASEPTFNFTINVPQDDGGAGGGGAGGGPVLRRRNNRRPGKARAAAVRLPANQAMQANVPRTVPVIDANSQNTGPSPPVPPYMPLWQAPGGNHQPFTVPQVILEVLGSKQIISKHYQLWTLATQAAYSLHFYPKVFGIIIEDYKVGARFFANILVLKNFLWT